jgi:hypothetical protein
MWADHNQRNEMTHAISYSRFTIGSGGSLVVSVGARQAVAVHVGELGVGTGAPLTAQQVPVMFYENATTKLGEVRVVLPF